MEDAQDSRQTKLRGIINWKEMSEEDMQRKGDQDAKYLKQTSFRKGKRQEDLGQTCFKQQSDPLRSKMSRKAASPSRVEDKEESTSSDELDLLGSEDRRPSIHTKGLSTSSPASTNENSSDSCSSEGSPRSTGDENRKKVKLVETGAPKSKKVSSKECRQGSRPRMVKPGVASRKTIEFPMKKVEQDFASAPERTRTSRTTAKFPMMTQESSEIKPVRHESKGSSKAQVRPLPMAKNPSMRSPSLAQGVRNSLRSKVTRDESHSSESDDPPILTSSDGIQHLRPFPMSSQDRGASTSTKPPSSSSVASVSTKRDSDTDDDGNSPKKRKTSDDFVDTSFDVFDSQIPKGRLCPYCDMPFPDDPSPLLQRMLDDVANSWPDPRPSNPSGRKAPLLSYINMCQRHQFETELLPQAKAAGWPIRVNFSALPSRISRLRKELRRIMNDKTRSIFWKDFEEALGSGVRKATSISGQLSSFEKSQPGYYGEQGAVIIYRTLCNLFPLEDEEPDNFAPLSLSDFLQRILVPECALALIREDIGPDVSQEEALRTLRESSKFGAAMYPDFDSSGNGRNSLSNSSGHGIGEAMLKERAEKNRGIAIAKRRTKGKEVDPETKAIQSQSSKPQKSAPKTLKPNRKRNTSPETVDISSGESDDRKMSSLNTQIQSSLTVQSLLNSVSGKSSKANNSEESRSKPKKVFQQRINDNWLLSSQEE